MSDIFSGLEDLGFSDIKDSDIFETEAKTKGNDVFVEKKAETKPINQMDVLFDRTVTCPVCDKDFITRTIKIGRLQFDHSDMDLRPMYKGFDPIPYDVVVCENCGYSALNRMFHGITDAKIKKVKMTISTQFKKKTYPKIYTYDIAIERYKLALFNAVVLGYSDGIKAYICLKISWLYRGWKEKTTETLMSASTRYEQESVLKSVKELNDFELMFISKAYEGFEIAIENEKFPILQLEAVQVECLMGELARRLGKYEDAYKWLGRLITRRGVNVRIKAKALEIKALVREEVRNKGLQIEEPADS